MPQNQEIQWIKQTLAGDEQAFGNIVDAYQNAMFNLCYRMLGNSQQAEEAAQESFWRAYQALSRYDCNRSLISWLLAIAAHHCIDQMRRQSHRVEKTALALDEELVTTAEDPEREMIASQQNEEIQRLIETLEPQDRAVVILRYWYDYPIEAIAQMLNATPAAVKSRLFRARRHLGQSLITQEKETLPQRKSLHESPAF